MLQELPGSKRVTVAGDKGFDTADFARECRNLWVTRRWRKTLGRRGGSAILMRTAQHADCTISQKRKRIEECFGWLKTIAQMRKVRHRGTLKVDWIFTFACRGLQSGAHAEPDAQRSSTAVRAGRSVSPERSSNASFAGAR